MDVKFVFHEAEDLEAAIKSRVHMVSYMDWFLGTNATLSRSGGKNDQNRLQRLLVSGGRCLMHMVQSSTTLYASVILKRCNAVHT